MTKQVEIEQWLNRYLTEQFICTPSELPDDECLDEAKKILAYLHSQGVVIKGESLGFSHPHLAAYFTVNPLI